MNIELTGLAALGILLVVLFFLMLLRDHEVSKKLTIYERAIEELNREHHAFLKVMEQLSSKENHNLKNIKDELQRRIKTEMQNSLSPMIDSIKELESIMLSFQEDQTKRIDLLENRMKEMNFTQANAAHSNEKTIISQYESGKSEAMIAKDLRIGIGEVDLILKLANLK